MTSLRRFTIHKAPGNPKVLASEHPAVVNATSLYSISARRHTNSVLISGFNSRKIGARAVKSRWKGMPIYTLTLEERATCPRSCELWASCYGNKMHWSRRQPHGPELEDRLEFELRGLQYEHPRGFIVRLHILGDFYSVEYVRKWAGWLDKFPALRIFGYTAREETDPIGRELRELIKTRWLRFAVRSSGHKLRGTPGIPYTIVVKSETGAKGAIVCPAQTDKTDCCGTCGLCWQSKKPIAFLEH